MGQRRLLLAIVALATVATAAVVAYVTWNAAEGDRLVEEATARLSAPLTEAPELDRVQASTALSLLKRARELGSFDVETERLEHEAQAIVYLQEGDLVFTQREVDAARSPLGWTADLHVIAAEAARRRTGIEAAREHLASALSMEPDHAHALVLAADLALDEHNARAAMEALQPVLEAAPGVASFHNRMALAMEMNGDLAGAERELREAVRLHRSDPSPWINLGRVLRAQGEVTDALAAFEQAVAAGPDEPDARLGRGLCHAALGQADEAQEDFRAAAAMSESDAEPLLALGDLLRDTGHTPEAVTAYRQALAREDADAASWLKLGNALVLAGEPGDAAHAFEEAIDRAPGLAAAHNGLGAALMHAGRTEDASEALTRAAELDTRDPNPLLNLALLREREGDRAGALRAWREALARDPASDVARDRISHLGG